MINSELFPSRSRSQEKTFFLISFFTAALGALLSIYATWHHMKVWAGGAGSDFACNINDALSCDKIALSPYSEVLSVPLGVWGVAFFITLMGLLFHAKKTRTLERKKSSLFLYGLSLWIGTVICLALLVISTRMIHAFCVTCIGVYLCNALLLGLFLFFSKGPVSKGATLSGFMVSSLVALGLLLSVVVSFEIIQTPLEKTFAQKILEPSSGTMTEGAHDHGSHGSTIPLATSPYMGQGEDYRYGNDEAPIVIHEFVDFQCPACRVASSSMKELIQKYQGKVLLVFRNYPLDMACNENIKRPFHANACMIAQLARCSGRNGKFWDFHDLAFREQASASPSKAREWAAKVGLSEFQVNNCLQDKAVLDKIRGDIALGEELHVTGTPSIYVNGQKFEGNLQALEGLISRLLAQGS